jgi:hypothetical protein
MQVRKSDSVEVNLSNALLCEKKLVGICFAQTVVLISS